MLKAILFLVFMTQSFELMHPKVCLATTQSNAVHCKLFQKSQLFPLNPAKYFFCQRHADYSHSLHKENQFSHVKVFFADRQRNGEALFLPLNALFAAPAPNENLRDVSYKQKMLAHIHLK